MNREGRAELRKAAEKFNRECHLSTSEFIRVTEALHDEEEDKLDRLPDQLRDSDKGGQIEDSIEMLEALLDGVREMEETVSDLLSEQGLTFAFEPQREETVMTESEGRKGTSFHAIFPSVLMNRLRSRARRSGLSMNEIVCRVLTNELCNETV